MNRKLLYNKQQDWIDLNAADNETILSSIEKQLELNSSLKRLKTLPRELRTKAKNASESATSDKNKTIGLMLKKNLKFGINTITKELEKNSNNIGFILVCRSCKPILTRHLNIMCAQSKVSAGCVKDLSLRLSKFFNLKTVSALAVSKNLIHIENQDNEIISQAESILNSLIKKITQCLPKLSEPYNFDQSQLLKEEKKIPIPEIIQSDVNIIKEIVRPPINEPIETFGSDFISIETAKKEVFADFSSNQSFILFNDEYMNEEYDYHGTLESIAKRKLDQYSYLNNNGVNGMVLNQLTIGYRNTNKDRKKVTKNKNLNKKKKLMNNLEQNKYKKS